MDNQYLEALFLEHYGAMEAYAYRFFHSRDMAQDVVQETFLIAQAKLDVLRSSPEPRGWLFNTLKNVMGNVYKQQKRLQETVPIQEHDLTEELIPSLTAAYDNLISPEELQLLIWIYCEGWPYQDIADRLGIGLAACKKRIQRARGRLKTALTAQQQEQTEGRVTNVSAE